MFYKYISFVLLYRQAISCRQTMRPSSDALCFSLVLIYTPSGCVNKYSIYYLIQHCRREFILMCQLSNKLVKIKAQALIWVLTLRFIHRKITQNSIVSAIWKTRTCRVQSIRTFVCFVSNLFGSIVDIYRRRQINGFSGLMMAMRL